MPDPAASDSLRVVFAGTPEFAAEHLSALIDSGCEIVGVYTQPDRPAGRGKKLQPGPVKKLALAHGLPLFQPENFKNPASINELATLAPDLMVVVAYGLILPTAVLQTPRYGCINVHASLLPRWRGAAPIQRAIEAGDSETGVTIMQMDVGLDTGDMLIRTPCPIDSRDTAASLHDKLIAIGRPALLEALRQIDRRELVPEAQDAGLATYAHKIDKAEARINWALDAATIDRQIRAFNPFPVCFTELDGQRIKIQQAFVLENHTSHAPGEILQLSDRGLDVQTGKGALRIERLQMPGKKALSVADVMRGYAGLFAPGATFVSEPETHS